MKIPANALVVGFVGSYAWFHQVHMIAEAAARLRERGIGPVYWLAVGEGPNRQKLDAISTQLGVDDLVIRQGRVPHDEVSHWLSAMDAAYAEAVVAGVVNTQPDARARLAAFADKSGARVRPNAE